MSNTSSFASYIFILRVLESDCWMVHHYVWLVLLWFINLDNKDLIQETVSSPRWGQFPPPNATCPQKASQILGSQCFVAVVVVCGTFTRFGTLTRGSSGKEALVWGAWSPLRKWQSPQTIKQQNDGKAPSDSLRLRRTVITFNAHLSSYNYLLWEGHFIVRSLRGIFWIEISIYLGWVCGLESASLWQ